VFEIVFDLLVSLKVVFFGGYAFQQYSKSGNKGSLDVLSEDFEKNSQFIVESLKKKGIDAIIQKNRAIGEIIPENIEIVVDDKTVACLYCPIACYSYNEITLNHRLVKIASIDTILSFYLAFIYVNKTPYDKDRILCMAEILFNIEQKHRTENDGILKRFSVDCYGKQKTLIDIRAEKTEKFKELSGKKTIESRHIREEFDWWFLRYRPTESPLRNEKNRVSKTQKHKRKNKNHTTKKRNIFNKIFTKKTI
jgi:hypothetical protein